MSAYNAGAGAQGEVYAAWWRGKPVAVKKFARAADAVHEVQTHVLAIVLPPCSAEPVHFH